MHTWAGFGAGWKSSILGVWATPAAPKTIPEGGVLRPPPFGLVVGAAGAAQTQQIADFWPAQKQCIKNPSVHDPEGAVASSLPATSSEHAR